MSTGGSGERLNRVGAVAAAVHQLLLTLGNDTALLPAAQVLQFQQLLAASASLALFVTQPLPKRLN